MAKKAKAISALEKARRTAWIDAEIRWNRFPVEREISAWYSEGFNDGYLAGVNYVLITLMQMAQKAKGKS